FLKKYTVDDSILLAHGNGEINYSLRGVHIRITSKWFYEAPGGRDSYYALLRGTKADLERKLTGEDAKVPVVYVWPKKSIKDMNSYANNLKNVVEKLKKTYPEIRLEKYKKGWKISSPKIYPIGHKGFSDVVNQYFEYLKKGEIPEWEVSYMIAKYYITTKALNIAKQ